MEQYGVRKKADYAKFNKEYEELRVKVTHQKAMSILKNVKKTEKKSFIEHAILAFYSDIKSGKRISNTIDSSTIDSIEAEDPTPIASGVESDVINQLLGLLASNLAGGVQMVSPNNQDIYDEQEDDIYVDEGEEDDNDIPF